jgi:CAAX prenyl protease-like protein
MPVGLSRPLIARALPFVLFMIMLAVRGELPADGSAGIDPRWVYGLTVLIVGTSLVYFWREYPEVGAGSRLSASQLALAVGAGAAVFAVWIQLDYPWMQLDRLMASIGMGQAGQAAATFRPVDAQGHLMWSLIAVRWIGATLLVPVMEELFWRSFLMRWIDKPDFTQVDPRGVTLKAVALSTFVFMLAHTLWLAAILAGVIYAWLYRRTGSLWAPIVAHGVTNGLLGAWVVFTGNWQFW